MNLSDDEFAVLLIAAQGAPMIPIGRWKVPTENLLELGLLCHQSSAGDPTGGFNCVITAAGRKACQARDQEDQGAFKAAIDRVNHPPHEAVVIAGPEGVPVCHTCNVVVQARWKYCAYCGVNL